MTFWVGLLVFSAFGTWLGALLKATAQVPPTPNPPPPEVKHQDLPWSAAEQDHYLAFLEEEVEH
jgi:hypothetical protein